MYRQSIIIVVLFLTALAVVYPVLNRNAGGKRRRVAIEDSEAF